MKTGYKILLFIVLLALPIAARQLWFYRGSYQPQAIPDPEQISLELPEVAYQPFQDRPQPGRGRVVIDLAHNNNLQIDDLTPLKERLAAREVEIVELTDYLALEETLRGATAYVTLAPTIRFETFERQALRRFVEDGGRILIAADPTRPVPPDAEEGFLDLFSIFFPTSAVPVANSLSSAFGVVYFDDYLYNLQSSEGNYRNVRFSQIANHPLTSGLDSVVFFAAHSLQGGQPLLTGDDDTRSNRRTGESGLSPAVLAADGAVLALGDLTFLTAPYHSIADNDPFLSNIADWLAVDQRDWNIAEFPYLFDDTVTLVPLAQGDLDPRFFVLGSTLQRTFDNAGIELQLGTEISPTQDTVLLGTYLDYEAASDILQTAGVTVTLTFSETAESETPTLDDLQEGRLQVSGLGTIDIFGTTLYVEHDFGDETALLILADSEQNARLALENLAAGVFEGCLEAENVTLCSTGQVNDQQTPPANGETGTQPPPGEDQTESLGSIFIFSDDDGPEGVRTSALDLQIILEASYDLTLWSATVNGIPTADDLAGYDAYIITSGDFAYDLEDSETFFTFLDVQGGLFFVGAQPLPTFEESETAAVTDLQVTDFSHPVSAGLPDVVIELAPSESGVPALVFLTEDVSFTDEEEGSVVLSRGPDSPLSGNPALIVSDSPDGRFAVAAFAFYRLPLDVQQTLALNMAAWLVGNGSAEQ